jgi:hypothetical protein
MALRALHPSTHASEALLLEIGRCRLCCGRKPQLLAISRMATWLAGG